ncbi:MAG: hypothetical protein FJZ16_00095 [Candidatus Omnitrophica bacterium]|nr:hypothetical protein [Candidatus Omnitrophota bacterium]
MSKKNKSNKDNTTSSISTEEVEVLKTAPKNKILSTSTTGTDISEIEDKDQIGKEVIKTVGKTWPDIADKLFPTILSYRWVSIAILIYLPALLAGRIKNIEELKIASLVVCILYFIVFIIFILNKIIGFTKRKNPSK